jgi:hypothetical protein
MGMYLQWRKRIHVTVLYGRLPENGHLEHRERNVNPLKRIDYCEVPLATTFITLNIVHRMYAYYLQNSHNKYAFNSTQN